MKSDYHERKSRRLEAFQRLAEKNENLSKSAYERSKKLADVIPFGQPILVGHHSERSHRSHIKKINSAMNQSIEADNKADYYAGKAETLLNGTAISSDNPDALDLLREKLENLLKQQELMKQINKILRNKKESDADKAHDIFNLGLKAKTVMALMTPAPVYGMGIPSFKLTNNSAVIRNTKLRIEHLEKIEKMQSSEEEINGVTLKISIEDNRVQLFFPSKPSEEVRTRLKQSGFRYSGYLGAWMRQISNVAVYRAKEILNSLAS